MPPAGLSVSGSLHDILNDLVPQSHHVDIRPHRLIVAWHGVLTLCFEAWPKQLATIKRRINVEPEFRGLAENFGTRWPKLTLAAFNDDAPPLTLDQLRKLTALCHEFDAELQKLGSIPLSHCSIAMFASRSLNNCLCRVDYAFTKEEDDMKSHDLNNYEQEYDADSYEIVRNVVSETDQRLDEYLDKVNAKGHR